MSRSFPFKKSPIYLAAFSFAFCTAHAENLRDSAIQVTESPRPAKVEEVVVTATRREESIQKVPMQITAITGDQLSEMGATQISDYFRLVPSLAIVDRGPSYKKYILRGINSESAPALQSVVQQYIDDFPLNASGVQPDIRLYDVDQIEVLRGPQGTLYGASAMGGTIRTLLRKPNLNKTEGYVETKTSYTHHGAENYGANGAINIPVIEGELALRLSWFDDKDDGYIDNLYLKQKNINDTRVKGGRLSLLWKPTDQLTMNLQHFEQVLSAGGFPEENPGFKAPTGGGGFNPVDGAPPANDGLNPIDPPGGAPGPGGGGLGFPDNIPAVGYYQTFKARNETLSEHISLTNLTVNYDFEKMKLTSATTVYARANDLITDFSETSGFGAYTRSMPGQKDFAQEFRLLSSQESKWQWLSGVYYWQTQMKPEYNSTFEYRADGTLLGDDHANTREQNLAFFGELSYQISPTLTATGGLRWANYTVTNYGSIVNTHGTDGHEDSMIGHQFKYDEKDVTEKLQLSWNVSDNLLVYTTAASGTRPGGVNGYALDAFLNPNGEMPVKFGPDHLWSYELGMKSKLLDNQLTLNGAAFYIDWRDMQARAYGKNNFLTWNGNVSNARIYGIEWEANYFYGPHFDILFSGVVLDAATTNNQPGACTPQERIDHHPKCRGTIAGFPALKGDRLPTVPRTSYAIEPNFRYSLGNGYEIFSKLIYNYVGKSYVQFRPDDPQQDVLEAYQLISARMGIKNNGWTFTLYAENLTDEHVQLFAKTITQDRKKVVIRPRTVGASLRYNF